MAETPVDLSPFRALVSFSAAGAHFALVSITASTANGEGSLRNWIEFVEPLIGEFGLSKNWELPAGEADSMQVYGYHVFSGNNASSPFGTLNLVNLARTLRDQPDPNRTHVVLDHVFEPFAAADPGRTGYSRCEVYQGPLLTDVIAHLESDAIYSALGSSFDTVRTAFQYRRDGVVGRIGAFEQAITVDSMQRRMRIRIPVAAQDHTPTFQLL